jgi:5S rRNA maturation endonuclease (ribonuclease M5)
MEQEIENEIGKYKDFLFIVEGKKDKQALVNLGFRNIFVINETGKSLGEKIEQIETLARKNKICILTDFDKKGKKLYLLLKSELGKRNVKMDNSLRHIFLRNNIQHIEDL